MRAIKKLIKKKNISIYKLSKAIGQSYQRTQYIVDNKNFSDDYLILKDISKTLGCDIEDLIDQPKKNDIKNGESK